MPKKGAKGNGGKNRRRGKGDAEANKRELELKSEDQEYALVTKMLGNGRLTADCYDGTTRQCHIRGKMRKKVWVNVGDVILVSLREYQDEKGDVIMKYNPDEARQLKKMGELPEHAKITEGGEGAEDGSASSDNPFEFDDVDIDDL